MALSKIAEIVVTSPTLDIDVDGIPQGGKDLLIYFRGQQAANDTYRVAFYPNKSSNNNADIWFLGRNGRELNYHGTGNDTFLSANDSSTTDNYSSWNLVLNDYSNTSYFKSFGSYGGQIDATVTKRYVGIPTGSTRYTTAITSLKFRSQGTTFNVGTKVDVYIVTE